MDEKGIKKIVQILTAILKLDAKGTLKDQGFNDRMGIAIEIYKRNKDDKEFVNALNKEITSEMEPLFEAIVEES